MLDKLMGRGHVFKTRDSIDYLFKSFTFLGMNAIAGEQKSWYSTYLAIAIICSNALAPFLCALAFIIKFEDMGANQILSSLQGHFGLYGAPPKTIVVMLFMRRLRRAEPIMDALDERCECSRELAKIRRLVIMGNRIFVTIGFCYGSVMALVGLCAIIKGEAPYSLYIPFINWQNSVWEFYLHVIIENFIVIYVMYYEICNDSYGILYIYIIRTHMQLLVERVRCLGSNAAMNEDENCEELINCIEDHQNLLKLLDVITPAISTTMFMQFFLTAIVLCTAMIQMFIFGDISSQIGALGYVFGVMLQITPCCYQATYLMEDSDQLPLAIFHIFNWEYRDKRFRKMLIFFMQRAQQTMELNALKIVPIHLNTSVKIAKFSFSLYTLIRNVGVGQNLNK